VPHGMEALCQPRKSRLTSKVSAELIEKIPVHGVASPRDTKSALNPTLLERPSAEPDHGKLLPDAVGG